MPGGRRRGGRKNRRGRGNSNIRQSTEDLTNVRLNARVERLLETNKNLRERILSLEAENDALREDQAMTTTESTSTAQSDSSEREPLILPPQILDPMHVLDLTSACRDLDMGSIASTLGIIVSNGTAHQYQAVCSFIVEQLEAFDEGDNQIREQWTERFQIHVALSECSPESHFRLRKAHYELSQIKSTFGEQSINEYMDELGKRESKITRLREEVTGLKSSLQGIWQELQKWRAWGAQQQAASRTVHQTHSHVPATDTSALTGSGASNYQDAYQARRW